MTNTPDFARNLVSKVVVTIPLPPRPAGISIQDSAALQGRITEPEIAGRSDQCKF